MSHAAFVDPNADEMIRGGGCRCAIVKAGSDWWVGYSPRNCSDCSEGEWADWVELAKKILERDAMLAAREGREGK